MSPCSFGDAAGVNGSESLGSYPMAYSAAETSAWLSDIELSVARFPDDQARWAFEGNMVDEPPAG